MLDIKVFVYDDDRDVVPSRFLNGCSCMVSDATSAVEQAYCLRELSSRRGGASGHKAWITVRKNHISLILYFMGPDVDFELYRNDVPDDESYCSGELAYDRVEELLKILDAGLDSIGHLRRHALTLDCSPRNSRITRR